MTICDRCQNYYVSPGGCAEGCNAELNYQFPDKAYREARMSGDKMSCKDFEKLPALAKLQGDIMNRYVVAQINPHVKNFYVVDTLIPEDSFCRRFYGKGDKRDQPFKTREEAQNLCTIFNQ